MVKCGQNKKTKLYEVLVGGDYHWDTIFADYKNIIGPYETIEEAYKFTQEKNKVIEIELEKEANEIIKFK